MSSLSHHGIKGQRWGVRRFQNKDGTRTAAGKKQEKQNRLKATSKDYASIRESLSDNDLKLLNYSNDEIKYMRKHNTLGHDHIKYGRTAHRVIQKDKNGTPVAYVDATWFKAESLLTGKKAASIISIDLATRAGDEYRGKGHAIAAGKKMVKWFDTYGYKDYEYMEWAAKEENVASQKTAEKLGFRKLDVHDEGWTLYAYEHKAKHTSIDDSPHLSHHGIKGQRWGVRRYQNKDGTRTALGKHRDFERTASKVVEDLSNSPRPFIRKPIDKDKIRQRGLITQAEADQCAGLATGIFKQASKVEPQITGDVIDVVSSTSAKMYGLNNRLKQPTSIAAKIGADAKSDGVTFEQAANGLKDVIRYTAVSDSRDYVDTYNAIKQRLEEKGYTEVKCKNYFQKYQNGEVMHKAVQSTFRNPDGVDFEFQFQTPESQAAKELKVPIYNERRKAGNTPERNMELEQEMRNLAEQVPDPEGVFGIKSHSGTTNPNKLKHTSIGGNMYIEGNALILGDSSYLEHHGILGQKWGIRRFQNKDGTRTSAGKTRDQKNAARSIKNAKEFRSSAEQLKGNAFGFGADKRALKEEKNYDDMAFQILNNGKHKAEYDDLNRDIEATASFEDENYRKNQDAMIEVMARVSLERAGVKNPNDEMIDEEWAYQAEYDEEWGSGEKGNSYDRYLVSQGYNPNEIHKRYKEDHAKLYDLASRDAEEYLGPYANTKITYKDKYAKKTVKTTAKEELANKIVDEATAWIDDYGAFERADIVYTDKELADMRAENAKYSPLKHSALFIEDGTLYLSHHGIRGQKWGVRRFQNRDGSLTNVGRKRLGYATKGAAQTVGKAFKAGVKTGAKAVKAAKAHHEKAEVKKIEKKKEKASKTRAGVMANKDLFTAKELKELNSKFEEQDKLTMARLKKGVEIAKAVGQYAQTAKQIGDAYQSITGKNILSHITEIKSANEAKAKEEKEASDKSKAEAEAATKKAESKAMAKEALQKNIDAFKADQESDARVKDLEKQGNNTAAKAKLAEYIDRYNQDKAAQEKTKQMMKNQKLQEYIDRANQAQREKDVATLRETTDRGKQVIDVLKRHNTDPDLLVEYYQNRMANSSNGSSNPKPPTGGNLMAQIKAVQAKLEKPNKNETPAEHKEAQKKLNELEKFANEYKAAANKPGTDPTEVAEKLLKKNKDILDDLKHMDFSDMDYLEHYGVRGMKWGKHLMAGKGGIYDGTALGAGGGGVAMTEEERKKAEELRKKKLEEAKKKAEEAAKEKEIKEKAKEIGISAKAYKNYSIEKNHLPGKHHYDKSQKLHDEASSSVAEAQAAERQAHMNRAKAASLNRKVNSSHMFDADGYHISQQRGDDRKEAKRLQKEAKQLDKASKKALKKFYKKRYKADKERQKWQNSTSGKYHHMMRHYEIQNGVLFIDESVSLSHHGIKGQKWGVRRFQNEDGTLTDKGRTRYEKALAKEKRKQVSSDAIRGTLERQHPFAVVASVALGATYAAMLGMASAAAPGAVVAGAAIAAAISGVGTHGLYSVSEAWEGRGTRMRSKKIAEYESMLKQSDMEEGMYHIENGTLFINAGEPYLEHHGVLGMKWGKHLRAGKGPADASASAGGGGGEDDEKLKEMAKKAGISVEELKKKLGSKINYLVGIDAKKKYEQQARISEAYGRMSKTASNAADRELAAYNADIKSAKEANQRAYEHGQVAGAYNAASQTYSRAGHQLNAASAAYSRASRNSKGAGEFHQELATSTTGKQFGKYEMRAQDSRINQMANTWAKKSSGPLGKLDEVSKNSAKKSYEKAMEKARKTGEAPVLTEQEAAYAIYKQRNEAARRRHALDKTSSQYNKAAKEYTAKAKEYASEASKYRSEQAKAKSERDAAVRSANAHATESNNKSAQANAAFATSWKNNKASRASKKAYENSLLGKYDKMSKRFKNKFKHGDSSDFVITDGSHLIVFNNSKWG